MAEWKTTRVSEFLKEREGRYKPTDSAVFDLKRLNKIDFKGEIHLSDKNSKTNMIIVEPGDLVISGINVSKGAIAVYHGEEPVAATIHYSSYQFDEEKIEIEYFKRFLKSKTFVQLLKEQVKGGIKTEIKPKHFLPLKILLPDIDSQKAIVSFFSSVESDMDELGDEIELQQEYLKKLRQQILQEAIEGKLTAEWRENNPELISGDNHASKLLEKIRKEREYLLSKGLIRKEKIHPQMDGEEPFILPLGWLWCQLADLSKKITDGTHFTPQYKSKGIQFVSAKDIKAGFIAFDKCRYISEEEHSDLYKRCNPEFNDLIVSKSGSIGTVVLNENRHQFSLFESLALVKYFQDYICPQYFKLGLQYACNNLKREHIKGVAVKHLHLEVLRGLLFPLPPYAEQKTIVERVDKLMSMIDKLEKQVTERKEQSEMLMQSVLKEALEG